MKSRLKVERHIGRTEASIDASNYKIVNRQSRDFVIFFI